MNQEYILAEQQFQQNKQGDGVDLNNLKIPYVLKDRVLMTPGMWNGNYYDAVELKKAFRGSDWKDKETVSLFSDHKDNSSSTWIGDVKNIRMQDDNLIGDLYIVDRNEAVKLAYGAKFGISPKFLGDVSADNSVKNLEYKNFSLVFEPACKNTFLNSDQSLIHGAVAGVTLELHQQSQATNQQVNAMQQPQQTPQPKKLEDMTMDGCVAMMKEQGYSDEDAQKMCMSLVPKQEAAPPEQPPAESQENRQLQQQNKQLQQEIQKMELEKQNLELQQKKEKILAQYNGRQTTPPARQSGNGDQATELTLTALAHEPKEKVIELQKQIEALEPEERQKKYHELAQKTPARERFAAYMASVKRGNEKSSQGPAGPLLGRR